MSHEGGEKGLTWKAFTWEVGARNQRSSPAGFVRRRRKVAFRISSCVGRGNYWSVSNPCWLKAPKGREQHASPC